MKIIHTGIITDFHDYKYARVIIMTSKGRAQMEPQSFLVEEAARRARQRPSSGGFIGCFRTVGHFSEVSHRTSNKTP